MGRTTSIELAAMHLQSDRRLVQVALAFVLVPTLWFYQVDLQLFGGEAPLLTQRFIVRTAMIVICTWGIWAMHREAAEARYTRRVLLLSCTIAACLFTLNVMRPAGSTLPLRTPLMNLMVMYGAMPNRRLRQVLPPLIFSLGLIILRLTWLTEPVGDATSDVLVIAVVNCVGVLMVWRRTELEAGERAGVLEGVAATDAAERALAELRSLQGIIPICSYCHEVRTEAGAWERLDHYVRGRTDAEFSHGICPRCAAEHFPSERGYLG